MNKLMLFAIPLFVFAPLARAAEPVKMETRMHLEIARLQELLADCDDKETASDSGQGAEFRNSAPVVDHRKSKASYVLLRHLENYGIKFSGEAFVFYDPSCSAVIMRNTKTQHAKLRSLLAVTGCQTGQIALDAAVVSFPRAEAEAVARKKASAAPAPADLITQWRSGKGRLIASQTIITRSGMNAQMQSVQEIICPTELLPAHWTEGPKQNVVMCSSPPLDRSKSFDTREAGLLINYTPTLRPDTHSVDLVIAGELCLLSATNSYDVSTGTTDSAARMRVDQPLFQAGKFTTQIVLRDGATAVMSDLNVPSAVEGWYLFLTARVLDSACAPMGDSDFSILLDGEPASP